MIDEREFVDLGLYCADVCRALDRGMNGKKLYDLNKPECEAIDQLTAWVTLVMHGLDSSLTTLPIAELWRRSEGWFPDRANPNRFHVSRRCVTRPQFLLGYQTSVGSFVFLMCVQPFLPDYHH